MITEFDLLHTSMAALALGISADTLKRKRDSNGGFLEHGYHYFILLKKIIRKKPLSALT